jgi:peroxiredoxin
MNNVFVVHTHLESNHITKILIIYQMKPFILILLTLINIDNSFAQAKATHTKLDTTRDLMEQENQRNANSGDKEYLLLNKYAPDFNFFSMQGEQISLSKYKNKVIFLNIFYRFCGPCLNEIPMLNRLAENFKDSVIFISISGKDSKAGLTNFFDYGKGKYSLAKNIIVVPASQTGGIEDGYLGGKHDSVHSENGVYNNVTKDFLKNNYNVGAVPVIFIIDAKGVIRYVAVGYDNKYEYYDFYVNELNKLINEAK